MSSSIDHNEMPCYNETPSVDIGPNYPKFDFNSNFGQFERMQKVAILSLF